MVGFQRPVFGWVEAVAAGRWRERGRLRQHYFCPPVWNGFLFISACVFSLLGIDTHKMKCSDMGSVRRTLLSRRHGLLTQTPLITSRRARGGTEGGHPDGDVAVRLRSPKAAGIFGVAKPPVLLGLSWGFRGGGEGEQLGHAEAGGGPAPRQHFGNLTGGHWKCGKMGGSDCPTQPQGCSGGHSPPAPRSFTGRPSWTGNCCCPSSGSACARE